MIPPLPRPKSNPLIVRADGVRGASTALVKEQ